MTEADLDVIEIWPENAQAFDVFHSLQTQWRVGFSGPTGLDYMVLYQKFDRLKLPPDEIEQLELDIQVMELAALGAMNDKTK